MSRPLRIEYPGAYYHVMNRGRGRQKTYRGLLDYQRFLNLLDETCGMWGVRVHAFSLLPNHYHLLLETPQGNLSRVIRHLDGIYTQRYNRAHHTDGPLFRGRYKAILVDADSYLLQIVRYIHLNPLEAKLVQIPERHRWTSHRYYLGKGRGPVGLVIEEVLGRFHSNRKRAIGLYRKFMGEGLDEKTKQLYERGNLPAIWGSEAFRERIKKGIRKRRLEYEIPQMKQERRGPTLREIEHEICRSYGIERRVLMSKRRGYWNEARNVAIYLGRTVGGYRLREIGERWGGMQYSSASGMLYAVRRKLEKDRVFMKRVEEIERKLSNQQT